MSEPQKMFDNPFQSGWKSATGWSLIMQGVDQHDRQGSICLCSHAGISPARKPPGCSVSGKMIEVHGKLDWAG
jgi:hypothetical protein